MPAKYFYCLQESRDVIEISSCLEHCVKGERCLPLPVLMAIGRIRPWRGKPSTTQCINGTRLAYLDITEDYAIDPFSKAFSLLGTRHHGRLEAVGQKANALLEEKLTGEVSGILDLLVPDEQTPGDWYVLWDYKTAGSFKVMKALGLVSKKVPDPSGEVYQKSGKWGKAGDPKMITIYEQDPSAVDIWEWEYQANNYRIMVEDCNFPISKMKNLITVRDGGLQTAKSKGLDQNFYIIDIKRLPDNQIREYFKMKSSALLDALAKKQLPPMCSDLETWHGRRCAGYCDLVWYCPEGQAIRKSMEGETEDAN